MLADLVDAYAKLEGIRILSNEVTRQSLEAAPFYMYGAPRSLSKLEVTPFVEGALHDSGFLLIATGGSHAYTIVATHMLKQLDLSWLPVEATDRSEMLRHPALLMQTTVTLSGVDARLLSNSMRPLYQSPWQGVFGLGDTDSLSLRGTGVDLASATRMLGGLQTSTRIQAQAAAPEAKAKTLPVLETSPRPVMATRIFELQAGKVRELAATAEELTRARIKEQYAGRFWRVAEDQYVPWPTPRFVTSTDTNRLLVLAAEEDLPRIEADLKLAAALYRQTD